MENEAKLKILQTTYAAVLAETVGHLGAAGLLEKVTEAKRRQAPATGARMVAQLGIGDPAEVFSRCQDHVISAAWAHVERIVVNVTPQRNDILVVCAGAGAAVGLGELDALLVSVAWTVP